MEEKDHIQSEGSNLNIIFGTSSDDIQQGLHSNQFIDVGTAPRGGDKEQIVNEEEQSEIVNPSEEPFNEPAPSITANDTTTSNEVKMQLEDDIPESDTTKDPLNESGKISKAED